MTRATSWCWLLALAGCALPEVPVEEEALRPLYAVDLEVRMAPSLFASDEGGLQPYDEGVVDPFTSARAVPAQWQTSQDRQVSSSAIVRLVELGPVLLHPDIPVRFTGRLELPSYLCVRVTGLPRHHFDAGSAVTAVTSRCLPVPPQLEHESLEDAARYLPEPQRIYPDPVVLTVDTRVERTVVTPAEATWVDLLETLARRGRGWQ